MDFSLEKVGRVYFGLKLGFGLCYSHVLLDLFQVFQIFLKGALDRQHQLQVNLRYLLVSIILFFSVVGPLRVYHGHYVLNLKPLHLLSLPVAQHFLWLFHWGLSCGL